jgi:hypothetical protein
MFTVNPKLHHLKEFKHLVKTKPSKHKNQSPSVPLEKSGEEPPLVEIVQNSYQTDGSV